MAESTAVIVETETTEVGVVIANTTVVGTVSASLEVTGAGVESVVAGSGVSVDSTDPANPIVTAQVTQAELDTEATTRAAADTALDGRLDAIEADYATDTDLTAEAATRAAADSALDTRVDALEAVDPLTQTEGDARYWQLTTDLATQVELNSEASTRASADTALDGRLDTLEAVVPVLSVVAGDNVTVDNTDPQNPVISAEAGSGGSGVVESVVAGTNIDVDATDPANPVVSVEALTAADVSGLAAVATSGDYEDLSNTPTLGTAAAADADDFDPAGSAAAAQAASQPLDADLTALAAAGNSATLAATTAAFTTADETKLDGIEAGAQVNVVEAFVWDPVAEDFVEGGRIFVGPNDPTTEGYTGQAGDFWLDPDDIPGYVLVDDDTFATASADTVPSSESVKAYVDAEVAGAGGGLPDVFDMFSTASPNAADDEFDDGAIAGAWTQLNVTGTVTWTEAKHALVGQVTADVAVSDLNAILKACTIAVGECVEIMVRVLAPVETSTGVLLLLTDGVTAAAVPMGGGLYMAGGTYPATWTMNGGTMTAYGTSTIGSALPSATPVKLRIRRSASTTYKIEYSIDGTVWTSMGTADITSAVTHTHAGIAITNVNGVNTGIVRIEYFRKYTA